MSSKLVAGVYTAALTPREDDGRVDVPALSALIRFQMDQGITAFALNGATGEFCLTTPEQLRVVLETVNAVSEGKARLLCGVGAAGVNTSVALARVAAEGGAQALLLPTPFYFPYEQQDVDLYCRTVAASTTTPILLYNLPQFSTGYSVDTARTLIQEVPNIIGIKDSSGSLDILRDLTVRCVEACRIVGNDSVLAPALKEGLCDGVVSGVACSLPEVILALYGAGEDLHSPRFIEAERLLQEFIEQLNLFPTPWGLKWIAEARGVVKAHFAQPVTVGRYAQADVSMRWFKGWHGEALRALASVGQ